MTAGAAANLEFVDRGLEVLLLRVAGVLQLLDLCVQLAETLFLLLLDLGGWNWWEIELLDVDKWVASVKKKNTFLRFRSASSRSSFSSFSSAVLV